MGGNHWDNIKCKIRKLSELRRSPSEPVADGRSTKPNPTEESERNSSESSAQTSEPERQIRSEVLPQGSEKLKKMSEASIMTNFSVSSFSLNEEVYEELPRAHKSILMPKSSMIEKDKRHRRKRRHGVSFVEANCVDLTSYSEVGTV